MKKKIVFLTIVLLAILISSHSYGKYVIEYTNTIVNINVDNVAPRIELLSVENSNQDYPQYANQTHLLTIKVNVIEKNIKENLFGKEQIKILVGEQETNPAIYEIKEIKRAGKIIVYEIKLKQILGDGKLKIKVLEKTIIDKSENSNRETTLETGVTIDNTAPVIKFTQQELAEGKILAKLEANEKVRKIEGWELSETEENLTREFANNVTYPLPVTDYAQNISQVEININKATYIKLEYGGLGANCKWEFGQGNNEIVGKEMITQNPLYKIELLSLRTKGKIENDWIQIQNYMHTYWGEGKKGLSYIYETIYQHGYNPSSTSYVSMASGELAYVNKEVSLILGGDGVNFTGNRGISKGNPIPEEIANQYLFGVSGLRVKIKDTSYYSIVYQIWVNGYGWLKPASDGEEISYAHDKPMGAYRMSLIPKTEKQYLIDLWSKDVGTNHM